MSRETSQERTERATPKRLHEAKQKGQVPRSRELSTTLMLLAGSSSLYFFGGDLGEQMLAQIRQGLVLAPGQLADPLELYTSLGRQLGAALLSYAPFSLLMTLVAALSPSLLGGWLFSTGPLAFRWSKLSPVKGLGRIFSLRGLLELVKALIKFLLVGGVAALFLRGYQDDIAHLVALPLASELAGAFHLFGLAFLVFSAATVLVAAADVPYQLWDHARQLRMTRQEVRDELKETDGRPEVRGRIRTLQREMAQRRMMEEVPSADVVVTNPTHFAVALRYQALRSNAPRVVAKGADVIASQIRQVATAHQVPIVEAPPLARVLYYNSELDQEIPASLYLAVAHVLAYVYQLRAARQSGNPEPSPPRDLPVPDDLPQGPGG